MDGKNGAPGNIRPKKKFPWLDADFGNPPSGSRKTILLLGLLVLVVVGVFLLLGRPEKKEEVTPESKEEAVAENPQTVIGQKAEEITQKATELLSPSATSRFELNGLIIDPDSPPMAIINDTPVLVGDTIENAEVLEITEGMVKLSCQGQEITLVLR